MQEPKTGLGWVAVGMTGVLAIALLAYFTFSTGCGGQTGFVTSATPQRWVNRTTANNDTFNQLMDLKLIEARAELLKPQVTLYGDPARPFTVFEQQCMQNMEPREWSIRGLPSVPAATLNALPNCQHCPYADPTPFIKCHAGQAFEYCNAYLSDGEISIPDAYLNFVGPWELDNKIMEACHVDIGAR